MILLSIISGQFENAKVDNPPITIDQARTIFQGVCASPDINVIRNSWNEDRCAFHKRSCSRNREFCSKNFLSDANAMCTNGSLSEYWTARNQSGLMDNNKDNIKVCKDSIDQRRRLFNWCDTNKIKQRRWLPQYRNNWLDFCSFLFRS